MDLDKNMKRCLAANRFRNVARGLFNQKEAEAPGCHTQQVGHTDSVSLMCSLSSLSAKWATPGLVLGASTLARAYPGAPDTCRSSPSWWYPTLGGGRPQRRQLHVRDGYQGGSRGLLGDSRASSGRPPAPHRELSWG